MCGNNPHAKSPILNYNTSAEVVAELSSWYFFFSLNWAHSFVLRLIEYD